jgi:hypothetical protein
MRLFFRSRLLPALFLLIGSNACSAAAVFNVLDYGGRRSQPADVLYDTFFTAVHASSRIRMLTSG